MSDNRTPGIEPGLLSRPEADTVLACWRAARGRGDHADAARLRRRLLKGGWIISLTKPFRIAPRPCRWCGRRATRPGSRS